MKLHLGLEPANVQEKLEASPEKRCVLDDMELTGGEPDVEGFDQKSGEYIFYHYCPRKKC